MKRVLAAVFVTLAAFNLATGQKKSTVFGDAWTGVVVSADETTREITIKYEEKGETKTFTGVLVEGYTAKTKDGGSQEIKVSDIPVGTRAPLRQNARAGNSNGQGQVQQRLPH